MSDVDWLGRARTKPSTSAPQASCGDACSIARKVSVRIGNAGRTAVAVLAQRETEDWKLVEEGRFRPTGGDFQGIGVYRSDRGSCR